MKIKMAKIVIFMESNSKKTLEESPMPASTGFRISRIIAKVEPDYQTFNEKRQELLKTYCKTDKDGNLKPDKNGGIQFKSEKDAKKFSEELSPVLDEEINLDVSKVKLSSLSKVNTLSPQDFLVCDWFIEE